MDMVRIGLVGCGAFGESHLRTFRAIERAHVAAAYDIDTDRARRVASEHGIPRVCDSLEEICALPELDAIDVVTSEAEHRDPVTRALRAGKHVFVEKPIATTLADAAAMVEAAEQSERILMVGQILRFETKYAMLKDEVAAGNLGDIVSMHARRNRPKSLLPLYNRTHPALENCIHDIDLMLWYAGRPVRRVRGYNRYATARKNPDTFWGFLEFEGGAVGVVETIWMLPEAAGITLDDAFQLIGTRAVGNIQLLPGAYNILRESGYHVPDFSYDPLVANTARGALREELAYFCEAVADGRECTAITPAEAKRALQVVLALIESAEKDKDVEVAD
jgi:UDP-N-acetylglucosamine 3-dehydrogenase